MRKYAFMLLTASLVLVGAGCSGSTTTNVEVQNPAPSSAEGRAVFTVTDAATELTGVTAVRMTVDKLEVHSATQGWMTVSTGSKTYDLLQLKATDSAELLADASLAAGTYDQVRLAISKVEVTADGKTQEAVLPSSSLKLVGHLTVTADQTSTAALDFMVDKSLHATGEGKYVMAPVVRLQVKSDASVRIGPNAKVEIEGGETESDETAGMDEKGEMKAGFELDHDLDLDAEGRIKVRLP